MPKANRYFSSILSKRYTTPQHQRMNIFGWHFLSYRCDKESDWKYSWVLRAVVPTRIAIFSGKWRDFYWMARELIWFDQKYSVNIVKLSFLAGGNNLGRASSRFRPQACSELLMLFSQENCHKNTAQPFPTKQNLWQKIPKIRLFDDYISCLWDPGRAWWGTMKCKMSAKVVFISFLQYISRAGHEIESPTPSLPTRTLTVVINAAELENKENMEHKVRRGTLIPGKNYMLALM